MSFFELDGTRYPWRGAVGIYRKDMQPELRTEVRVHHLDLREEGDRDTLADVLSAKANGLVTLVSDPELFEHWITIIFAEQYCCDPGHVSATAPDKERLKARRKSDKGDPVLIQGLAAEPEPDPEPEPKTVPPPEVETPVAEELSPVEPPERLIRVSSMYTSPPRVSKPSPTDGTEGQKPAESVDGEPQNEQ